jgi:hypothetical protein
LSPREKLLADIDLDTLQYYDHEDQRPGGNTTTAIVTSIISSTNQTYRLIGDRSSVTTVLNALIADCGVSNSTSSIAPFAGFTDESNTTLPKPEQFVQWYRASSFGLSLDGYNNSASLQSNMPASNTSAAQNIPNTPLPSYVNSTFLACLNTTIAFSIPLVNPAQKTHLSRYAIGGIVTGAIIGFILLLLLGSWMFLSCKERQEKRRWKAAGLPDAERTTRNGKHHYASLDPPPPSSFVNPLPRPLSDNPPLPSYFVDPYDAPERLLFSEPSHVPTEPKPPLRTF